MTTLQILLEVDEALVYSSSIYDKGRAMVKRKASTLLECIKENGEIQRTPQSLQESWRKKNSALHD